MKRSGKSATKPVGSARGAVSRDGIVKSETPVFPILVRVSACWRIAAPSRVVRRVGDLRENSLAVLRGPVDRHDR